MREPGDLVLVETAAREDLHALEPGPVQQLSRRPGQDEQVARVQPHGPHPKGLAELPRQADHLAHPLQRVVGIHQKHGFGLARDESAKGLVLARVRLHVAVGHGAAYPDSVDASRQDVRRRRHARDVKRSRPLHGGVGTLHAAQTEVGDGSATGRGHDARRLGGGQRLNVDLIHDEGLDELRLGQGCGDLQDGLAREDRGSLRHRAHVAAEPELRQVVERS
jgi:hypothetical protein